MEVSIIGLDLAKHVFQAHGADASGAKVFSKKLRRGQLAAFFAGLKPVLVVMEACAGAHYWAREIARLGHEVRLIAPQKVKPYLDRQKNDAADAAAIAEAASRPKMRFVAVKSEAQQAAAVAFRVRDLLVRQRTQAINALRGHLAEFGVVAPQGRGHVGRLVAGLAEAPLPAPAHIGVDALAETIAALDDKIAALDREIARRAKESACAQRVMGMPGVGPITAIALEALAPPAETFRCGRDFSAWLGLVPLQRSSGGKERLGRISKMGEASLRRLFLIGAASVVRQAAVGAVRAGASPKAHDDSSWLARMLARKPRMLVIAALANKMARTAWALMRKGESYREGYRAPVARMPVARMDGKPPTRATGQQQQQPPKVSSASPAAA